MKKLTKSRHPLWSTSKFNLKMKLTTFLLIVSLFKIQANTYSQTTRISINLEQATIQTVLDEIERTSEFKFLVDPNEVDLERIVSVKEKKQKITVILDKLFASTNVSYSILDEQIILKPQALIRAPIPEQAIKVPQHEVSGTVIDQSGIPLAGVNVIQKGTTNGISTDFDGNYSIKFSDNTATLIFSYLGFVSQEILVGDQTTINITMLEDSGLLEEVVVPP